MKKKGVFVSNDSYRLYGIEITFGLSSENQTFACTNVFYFIRMIPSKLNVQRMFSQLLSMIPFLSLQVTTADIHAFGRTGLASFSDQILMELLIADLPDEFKNFFKTKMVIFSISASRKG